MLAIVVAVLAGVAPSSLAASDPILGAALTNLVSRYGGMGSDFTVLSARTMSAYGVPLWSAKFLDNRNGEVRIVYRREDDGSVGGPEVLRSAIAAADAGKTATELKASDELRVATSSARPDDLIAVAVWFAADTTAAVKAVVAGNPEVSWVGDRPTVPDLKVQRAIRAELDAARSAVYRAGAMKLQRRLARTVPWAT